MLYLWIFGDNVEDRFAHGKFTVFYLLCGLAATFAQLAFGAGSNVPNLGASGATAGVLGAYILLFPQGKVNVLVGQGVRQFPSGLGISPCRTAEAFEHFAAAYTRRKAQRIVRPRAEAPRTAREDRGRVQ